jgi:hypothetical protein
MTQYIAKKPIEGSTARVQATFRDADKALVTPNALLWKLTDEDGNIINSRNRQVVSPATTVTVALSGKDLQIIDNLDSGKRIFTIEGDYDSALGSGLPIKEALEFSVEKLVTVISGDVEIEMGVGATTANIRSLTLA